MCLICKRYGDIGCWHYVLQLRSETGCLSFTIGRPLFGRNISGLLLPGVTGKDVIVALCGLFSQNEVLNHAIEFTGSEEAMSSLRVNDRLAIANMTSEWGALTGLFPIDETLQRWHRYSTKLPKQLPTLVPQRAGHVSSSPISASTTSLPTSLLRMAVRSTPNIFP